MKSLSGFLYISILIPFIIIGFNACKEAPKNLWEVNSPSGNVKIALHLSDDVSEYGTQLTYSVAHFNDNKETVAIEKSPLGMVMSDEQYVSNLKFSTAGQPVVIDETFTMLSGKFSEISSVANELTVSFQNENQKTIELIMRAYDDGVAFRYNFPDKGEMVTLIEEKTGFNLPDNGKAWMHAYDTIAPWAPGYERFYQNAIDIGTPSPDNRNGWSFPMLFYANDIWTLISDADLDENYCGMHINDTPTNGLYTLRFPEENEAYDQYVQKPSMQYPFMTPWRFIVVSTQIGEVLESNMVNVLSPPNTVDDVSWIKSGRASWSWWSDNPSPRDYDKLKHFVDFAADMGWEYSLVDANWNEMEGGNMQQLAAYANSKDVGILVWYNSGGPHNVIMEGPRDKMHEREARRAEFKKLQEWGVKGIKVDFFQSDKQGVIKQYHDILKDAAEFHILVNFHGCTLPRGWSRTYPHLLTMEAIRGGEAYRFERQYPDYGPVHNTIIPFTRNVVGPVDYTPVTFSDAKYPHKTTFAHELALSVIFESGITHFADHADVYAAQPDYVIDFLKAVPAAWDETKYLSGYPGDHVVIARRKGAAWYIAGINGLTEDKTVELDLSFFERDLKGYIIKDGAAAREFSHADITSGGTLSVTMSKYGGFVLRLE